jgi:hypothetical protein
MSEFGAGESSNSTSGGNGAGGADKASPKDMAVAAGQTVQQEVASFASAAEEKAHAQAQSATESATRTLGEFASAVKKAGDELSQHDQSLVGKMVKQAGDGLENLARSLADKSPEDLIEAARDFSRRNPAAFIAGGVLLGLAAGRFLRSSAPQAAMPVANRSGEPRSFASPAAAEAMPGSAYGSDAQSLMDGPFDLQESQGDAAGGGRPYPPGI